LVNTAYFLRRREISCRDPSIEQWVPPEVPHENCVFLVGDGRIC